MSGWPDVLFGKAWSDEAREAAVEARQRRFSVGQRVEVPRARSLAHMDGTVTRHLPNNQYEVTHGGPKKHQQTVRQYHEFELEEPKDPRNRQP